jgi:two-component system cell cycle sensor histidine kinase/response regulator CckA
MDALFWGQWKILERVAQGAPLQEVLDSIVRLIEHEADGMLCSILLFDTGRQTLRHGAAPSLPTEYTDAVNGAAIGPEAGSCGAAAFTLQPVIVEDTSVHPNWAPWRDLAQRHRLRACWSTPIFSPEQALLGTFAMYYHEPRRPTPVEEKFIATATHLTGIAITLDRQSQLQEQLRQAQRLEAVGKLASGVAHDFNNLLSVIVGYAAMITESLSPSDGLRGDVEEISRAASRAGELTRQLLAFGRQQVLLPRVVDLNRTLPTLEKMLRRVAGDTVVFELALGKTLGRVQVDPGQLEQVVLNLVVNARDAMPRGGRLTLATADATLGEAYAVAHPGVPVGKFVRLSVSDTGDGMEPATRARVFEPFFTTKEQGKGTGLGLSTVWGIVTQSGGHVDVESAPGQGSTFNVYLPAVGADVDVVAADLPAPLGVGGSETILVVEDEEQVRTLLCSVLRRAGYTVLEAQNGSEGLLVSQRHPHAVQLLLTDVIMPRINGRELARRLQPERPDMQVLYCSGYPENLMVDNGVLDPGVAFLAKPVSPQQLLHKVREVLDASKVVRLRT